MQAIRDEHEIIPKIERWRELTKLKLDLPRRAAAAALDRNGRLHTTFNQTTATTGRPLDTNPNLQNIPIRTELGREIRACFIAEPGNLLVSADYSQVELRILAHIAGEEALREIFARGEDVHTATAADDLRRRARADRPGDALEGEDGQLRDRLRALRLRPRRPPADPAGGGRRVHRALPRALPAVRQFIDETIACAAQEGYVQTLFGRRRRIPELRARNRQTRQLGERLAVNTVIQGTAADIIKVAMVRSHNALAEAGLATRLILQIHDELLFEGPDEEAERAKEIVCARDGGGGRAGPAARRRGGHRRQLAGGQVVRAPMDRGLAVILTALVGGLIALQAPINSMLGKAVGTWQAATVSFALGTVVLATIVLVAAGGFGEVGEARHLPWYYLTGGLLGAAYVTTVLVTVRSLGAGGVTAATIAGQLTLAIVVDQLGILGVEKQSITWHRLVGVLLLAVGTFLVVRD